MFLFSCYNILCLRVGAKPGNNNYIFEGTHKGQVKISKTANKMGKLYVSHLVIHDNLKLPITREGAFNLVQPKNCNRVSKQISESKVTIAKESKVEPQASNNNHFLENVVSPELIKDCNHNCYKDNDNIMNESSKDKKSATSENVVIHNEATNHACRQRDKADGDYTDTLPTVLLNGIDEAKIFDIDYDEHHNIGKDQGYNDNVSHHSEEDVGISMKQLETDKNNSESGDMVFDPANLSADSFVKMLNKKIEFLENQVAGHMHGGKSIGLIKDNGKVLKPILKKDRELDFYEKLQNTSDLDLVELRDLVPKFYGTKTVLIDGIEYNSIILEDLTKDYKQPCIIDIKIGKRTWDPLATPDKIKNEEKKYADCKRDLSLCIPGFQVYNVRDNKLYKFGKEYGKSLNKDTCRDAFRTFLNGEQGLCRNLLVQILGTLWRIEHWARKQRAVRLFSSSILIVYEGRRLREHLKIKDEFVPRLCKLGRSKSLYRPLSLAVLSNNECEKIQTGFSGQLTKDGPILHTRSYPSRMKEIGLPVVQNKNNTWKKSMNMLKRTHSFQNDYDKEVKDKKQDYVCLLDELVCEETSEIWATVKMIDFAHAFPGENCDIDKNYLEGISKLVKIFEDFLAESE